MAMLYAFAGLPGTGKTTIARALAEQSSAVHLRVDSVEAALKNSSAKLHPAGNAGYLAIAAIALDNLALGLDVIADTVNPVEASRILWAKTAARAGAELMNIEVICSDKVQHRRRVENRQDDLEGFPMPDWEAVMNRPYEDWADPRMTLDTAHLSVSDCVQHIIQTGRV